MTSHDSNAAVEVIESVAVHIDIAPGILMIPCDVWDLHKILSAIKKHLSEYYRIEIINTFTEGQVSVTLVRKASNYDQKTYGEPMSFEFVTEED